MLSVFKIAKYILFIPAVSLLSTYSFFYLILNRKIFKNKYIFVSNLSSFGHQCIAYYALNFFEKNNENVSVIEILYSRNNSNLSYFFNKIDNFFLFSSNHSQINIYVEKYIYKILKFLTKNKNNKILNYDDLLKIKKKEFLQKQDYFVKFYNKTSDKVTRNYENFYWLDLMLNNIKLDCNIKPNYFKKIKKRYNFKKKIASICFRTIYTNDYYDQLRSFNPNNYDAGIKWLLRNNYTIINHNREFNKFFKRYKEVLNLSDISHGNLNFDFLNLLIIAKSNKVITQHSGIHIFPALFGIETIMCDVFPFCSGATGDKSILLFKNSLYKGNKINIKKIHKYDKFFYGKLGKNYHMLDNTNQQILVAIKSKNKIKINYPKDSLIGYRKNWIVNSE